MDERWTAGDGEKERERLIKVEQCAKMFQLDIVSALTSVSFFSDDVSFRSALPDLRARSATRKYICVRFHRGLRNRCHNARKSTSSGIYTGWRQVWRRRQSNPAHSNRRDVREHE